MIKCKNFLSITQYVELYFKLQIVTFCVFGIDCTI